MRVAPPSLRRALLQLITRPGCGLCEDAKETLLFVTSSLAKKSANLTVDYEEVDITAKGNESYYSKYQFDIPVIHLNGAELCRHRVTEEQLLHALTHPKGPKVD
eukprot:TRINITY_DN7101_c0_g1_i1.p3 TRINITY_DN7101_c0_g1~~TRINITY_DN7101_c0_g1_i1.p3  ORF type:complete len:104 (-),score=19.35 TRINITY_DN7101_c0_g1_i1:122-433(-)